MELTYDDIIHALIRDFEDYVPDGISHSRPVVAQENGKIVDCFFLYTYNPNKSEFSAPSARLTLEPREKKLVRYYSSDEMPFGEIDTTQMFKVVSEYTKEQRLNAYKQYPNCYMDVRRFAFQKQLSQEQLSILSHYYKTFTILVPTNQKIFYVNLSPSFFEWMAKMLGPGHEYGNAVRID